MGGKNFSLPVFPRKTSRKKGKKSEYMNLNGLNVIHKDLTWRWECFLFDFYLFDNDSCSNLAGQCCHKHKTNTAAMTSPKMLTWIKMEDNEKFWLYFFKANWKKFCRSSVIINICSRWSYGVILWEIATLGKPCFFSRTLCKHIPDRPDASQ